MLQKSKKIKIGIDIDNVISDSTPVYLKKFNEYFKTELKYEEIRNFYHIEENTNIPEKEVSVFFESLHVDDFTLSLPPIAEAREVINKWGREGYKIHYITARPARVTEATKKWLKKHGFLVRGAKLDLRDHNIDFYDTDFKKLTIKKVGVDIFIEDIKEIAEVLDIPVLLLDKPWNQGRLKTNIHRVYTWREIAGFISGLTF